MVEYFQICNKSYSSSIMTEIKELYDSSSFTDVTIIAGHEEFPCHKLILAASSCYFRTMFSGSFKENLDSKVCFNSLSPWSMKSIIDFVYTGECRVSLLHIQELMQTAKMLEYPKLVQECARLMALNIELDNCFAILDLSMIFGIEDLEQVSRGFIRKNFTRISESSQSEWLRLESTTVLDCVADSLIEVRSERAVWAAISRWLAHDVDTRLIYLPDLVTQLRLDQLGRRFVENQLLQSPLVVKCYKTQNILTSYKWPEDRRDCDKLSQSVNPNPSQIKPNPTNYVESNEFKYNIVRPSTVKKPCMVLLGGMDNFILNRVDGFNVQTSEWTSLAGLPENNVIWFASCSMNNKIYISGGIKAGEILDRLYAYDSDGDMWYNRQHMLTTRAKHSSAAIDNHLFIIGGITSDVTTDYDNTANTNNLGIQLNTSVNSYDELTDQWTRLLTKVTNPRMESCLVPVQEKRIYGDPDEPIIHYEWFLYEIGGTFINSDENDQISIYRVDKDTIEFVQPLDYYIKLPDVIKNAKCAVDQKNSTVYILWENSRKLARLNVKTNSIHFLPQNPFIKLNDVASLSNSTINTIHSTGMCFIPPVSNHRHRTSPTVASSSSVLTCNVNNDPAAGDADDDDFIDDDDDNNNNGQLIIVANGSLYSCNVDTHHWSLLQRHGVCLERALFNTACIDL